jgi:hypothetical protein
VCKTFSHKHLYEWVDEFTPQELGELYEKKRDGKKRMVYRYRYRNGVPLKDCDTALQVNWMEKHMNLLLESKALNKKYFPGKENEHHVLKDVSTVPKIPSEIKVFPYF